jgi:putative sterol carrier protein
VRYLSNEWIKAANAAVQAAASAAPANRVVVDQRVSNAVDYRITIERDACAIVLIDDAEKGTDRPAADAVFRQSLDTARAVAQGTTDAHQAFLLGQITFEGNIDVLIERRDAFTWLESVLAPVLAQTTFD